MDAQGQADAIKEARLGVQPCGRLDSHPPHSHLAALRPVVTPCVCDARTCVCPEAPEPLVRRLRAFACTGKPVAVEGAPAHLPVRVEI